MNFCSRAFMRGWLQISCALFVCAIFYSDNLNAEENEMTVANGKMISLEYTLKGEDKEVIESNKGADPLVYLHGSSQIIPGLEKGLEGMKEGETKEIEVAPEEGYGEVDESAFLEVPKDNVPEEARKVGAQLQTTTKDGNMLRPTVSELKEEAVVLNFNHPLAGQKLVFDVKVLDIKEGEGAPSAN